MPTSVITRVDPLDLQKNIAIGISLPFNGPAGPFNKTYTTKDQIKSNLLNLILTDKGERIMNPEFGIGLRRVLFDNIGPDLTNNINNIIRFGVSIFMPEITIENIQVDEAQKDNNIITITINYIINISSTSDQVTVEFI